MSRIDQTLPATSLETERVSLLVRVRSGLRVSAKGFWRLCRDNSDLRLERSSRGELIVMAPAGSESGHLNAGLTGQLWTWARKDGSGLSFDSSAGFTLPNEAIRSPDASWIRRERWEALPLKERRRFARICPDFVVELLSPSDSLADVREKLGEYIDQGAQLGWLIDPQTGLVEIYRRGRSVETLDHPLSLSGEDVLPGFVLDLKEIFLDASGSKRNDLSD